MLAIDKNGGKNINWGCDESTNCFKKTRHAPSTLDYLFSFGCKIRPSTWNRSQTPSYRRCRKNRGNLPKNFISAKILDLSPSPIPSPARPNFGLGARGPKIQRMRQALDSSDVELVKLMVREKDYLDESITLHYAVENCSWEVVKALLELGAANVNHPVGPAGKPPSTLHPKCCSPTWW